MAEANGLETAMTSFSSFTRISLYFLIFFLYILGPSEQIVYKWKGHYRISSYPKSDESYLQTSNIYYVAWNFVVDGLPKLFKKAPVWGSEEPKYLDQIKFNCYFAKEGMPAVKTNAETSQLIKEDFTFTSRDIRENPGILRPFFEKRKHQRYAFVIHGYNTGHLRYDIHLKPYMEVIAADLRSNLHMNVIRVDWTELSIWDYLVVSKGNTRYVAEAIRAAIFTLSDIMQLSPEEEIEYLIRMLLLGQSLGAHVAGLVGDLLTIPAEKSGERRIKRLGTIVGVDPCGPLFLPYNTGRHCLTLNDARRVIILHTGSIALGISYRLGHEDYYANGGVQIFSLEPLLAHLRSVNLIRELIWTKAVGYICKRPGHIYRDGDMSDPSLVQRIDFDLAKISQLESEVVPHPIYLPVNLKYPYFDNDKTPEKMPAYTIKTSKGWEKIRYKFLKFFHGLF